jgi:hypothetical protein
MSHMGLRRQAYEWRNIVPTGQTVSNTGHPILTYDAAGVVQGTVQEISANVPVDIMVGGIGNNLEEPAMLRAHQFVVIDYLAAWPVDSAFLNIRIGTTRYFQDPSGVPDLGMPAAAMPFNPADTPTQFLGHYNILNPPVYVLPGQTWGIEFATSETLNAGSPVPTADTEIARAYVRYLLIDGPDMLIAMRLLEQNIPVSAETIQWFKRQLIRHSLMADVGSEESLNETLAGMERRLS